MNDLFLKNLPHLAILLMGAISFFIPTKVVSQASDSPALSKAFMNYRLRLENEKWYIETIELTGRKDQLPDKYQTLAKIFLLANNFDSAEHYLRKSIIAAKILQNHTSLAKSYDKIGEMFEMKTWYDSAMHYLMLSRMLREEVNDSSGSVESAYEFGLLYFRQKQLEKSEDYAHKSLSGAQHEGAGIDMAKAYYLLGRIYYWRDEYRLSEGYFLKCESTPDVHSDSSLLCDLYYGLGSLYRVDSVFDRARAYFYKGMSIAETTGNILGMTNLQTGIGLMYLEMLQNDSAIHYLNQSYELARMAGLKSVVQKSLEYLADARENEKNYKGAFELMSRAYAYNDTLNQEKYWNAIADMETRYKTEKKQRENDLLRQRILLKTRERNMYLAGSLVVGIIAFLTSLYFRQRALLHRKSVLIEQQKVDDLLKDSELKTYNAMMEGQDAERQRIASDLHDRLGILLATVKMHFSTVEEKFDSPVAQFTQANTLLDEACDEVRRVSHNLSTGMLMHFGLRSALNELMETVEGGSNIKTKLLVYGLDKRLDQQTEIGIYRIIQECISNILKHAQAKNITLQLNKTEHHLNITVEDDGVGFDINEKMKSSGMGLKNISVRAEKLNGKFSVDSTQGKGTTSVVEIPLQAQLV